LSLSISLISLSLSLSLSVLSKPATFLSLSLSLLLILCLMSAMSTEMDSSQYFLTSIDDSICDSSLSSSPSLSSPPLSSSISSSLSLFSSFLTILKSFSLFLLILLMCGIAFYIHLLIRQWWKLRHFRSPFTLPLIGNCYNPEAFTLFRYLARLRKQLGNNFVIYLFTNPYLVMIDPQVVKCVLSDSKSFSNPKITPGITQTIFGNGILSSSSFEFHSKTKTFLLEYFSLSSVSKSIPILSNSVLITISQLFEKKLLLSSTNMKISVNLDSFFTRIALRSFLNYTCGVDLRGDLTREDEICESLVFIEKSIGKVNLLPTKFFSTSNEKDLISHTEKVNDILCISFGIHTLSR
jgi:hypothetical protein